MDIGRVAARSCNTTVTLTKHEGATMKSAMKENKR